MSQETIVPPAPDAQQAAPLDPQPLPSFQHRSSLVTLVTLANAAEVVGRVAARLQGGDARRQQEEGEAPNLMFTLAASTFQKKINKQLKG